MYKLEAKEFEPHPEGNHKGYIRDVKDEGEKETQYGKQHKISVWIVSTTSMMDNGEGFLASRWYNLSCGSTAHLTELREKMAPTTISHDQLVNFDPDVELKGRNVGYKIVHRESNGKVYANILDIWPLDDGEERTIEKEKEPVDVIDADGKPYDEAPKVHDDEELPF